MQQHVYYIRYALQVADMQIPELVTAFNHQVANTGWGSSWFSFFFTPAAFGREPRSRKIFVPVCKHCLILYCSYYFRFKNPLRTVTAGRGDN